MTRFALAALAAAGALLIAVVAFLPAFPLDETRYLTVAWEMRVGGSWGLPTLNFEPYSHKPPLLFWLINASWSVLGPSVAGARMAGFAAALAALWLTHRLERALAPEAEPGLGNAALMLAGLPLFVMLGGAIMFDMLLTAIVLAAMLALWHAGRSGDWRLFAGYGICVGLGVLTKGPVALLFTVPVALLARFWADPARLPSWFLRVGLAILLGLLIALAWALRAGYLGGPAFAEMLFWKQSAGRMTDSFAHARPFWFYMPTMLLFFLPLLVWRPGWGGIRAGLAHGGRARNFLLAWSVPPLVLLSLISGKQPHYLLPLVPAVALLIALGLRYVAPKPRDRLPWIALCLAGLAAIVLLGLGGREKVAAITHGFAATLLSELNLPVLFAAISAALAAHVAFGRSLKGMLTGLAAANLIFLAFVAEQARESLAPQFDLQPLADAVAPYREGPIATNQRPRGEIGFLARLDAPLVYVPDEDLDAWIAAHPGRVVILRDWADSTSPIPTGTTLLYRSTYRLQQVITLVQAGSASTAAPSR